ncbi:hypothetical protein CSKR_110024 [Clonorchis sinensis]|uniref:Uncharacterized protein n=1 Tax=Clonorchis sinensis TaxID=79923 RepID=A0A419PWV6_CLOSI|nr:hypothetical protein CSKR_110024 [Clonorchis sinensis]
MFVDLKPSVHNMGRNIHMELAINYHHGAHRRRRRTGDTVYVENFSGGWSDWIPGHATERVSGFMYGIRVSCCVWSRHVNHVRRVNAIPTVPHPAGYVLFSFKDESTSKTETMMDDRRCYTRIKTSVQRLQTVLLLSKRNHSGVFTPKGGALDSNFARKLCTLSAASALEFQTSDAHHQSTLEHT